MTRFLLDENVPLASVHQLRSAGHDAVAVAPGVTDRAVLEQACAESRVLVTYDRDFGFLALRAQLGIPPGIVYLRSQPASPEAPAIQVLAVLATPGVTLEGNLTVIESHRIRQRRLP